MSRVLVLNGPNLNLLGQREPSLYGARTLADIVGELTDSAAARGVELRHFQSQAEHELVERVHRAVDERERFILINPGAFTHTSVALRDALLAVGIPFIEVHLSNIHAREQFRRVSYLSDVARGTISGLGAIGYQLALDAAIAYLGDTHAHDT